MLYFAVGGSHVIGNDVTWLGVTNSDVYYTFHFLQRCITQWEAVTWQNMTSRNLGWPKVTRKWRHLTGSHLGVAVEGLKLASTVHFNEYKAVARSTRQSCEGNDVTWTHVIECDPGMTPLDRKSPGSVCRRPKTHVHCTFHFLQGCSLQ